MVRRSTRLVACAGIVALTGVLSACGGGAAAAGSSDASTPSPTREAVPAEPRIAAATVAPAPQDAEAAGRFGADAVAAGYAEMVELATVEALDPAYFAWTGNNTADLLAPIYSRLAPDILSSIKAKAQECLDAVSQSCTDIQGLAFFDVGTDWQRFTFLPDGTYVTEQSVTSPTVSLQSGVPSRLVVSLDHAASVHVAMNGTPVALGITRHLTYYLVPAPGGSRHEWQISAYEVELDKVSLTDPDTGQPVPFPTDPSAPTA